MGLTDVHVVLVRARDAGRHLAAGPLAEQLLAEGSAEHVSVRPDGPDLLVVLWLSAAGPRPTPWECAAMVRRYVAADCVTHPELAGPAASLWAPGLAGS